MVVVRRGHSLTEAIVSSKSHRRLASDCLLDTAPRPLMVADMVSESGDWDWARLCGVLPPRLLEQVGTVLPPHSEAGPDVPSWRLEDRRIFTMKSAYNHIFCHNGNDDQNFPVWKRVWKIQIPQRIRVFLWLALHRRLLTNVERERRHLTASVQCAVCFDGPEDMIHVLRDCMVARSLWSRVLTEDQYETFTQLSGEEWIRVNLFAPITVTTRQDWPQVFAIFCWLLWKNRCCRIMGSDYMHYEELLARGNRLLDECIRTFSGSRNSERRGPLLIWKRPASGWIKVNVDAAVNVLDQRAVVGGVYRDSDGEWRYGFSRNIGRCSVVLAELWAILEAIRRAWEKGYRFVVLESDCADAVRMILGNSEVFVGHSLVAAIQSFIRRDWQLSISWISRDCNVCADRLVALGRGQTATVMDYAIPPIELFELVMEEALVSV
ncbi:hypothetical protein GQ457_05G007400 [Hibiscus cannabinus]